MKSSKKLGQVYTHLHYLGSFGQVYKIRRKIDDKILVWKELDYGKMSEREKKQVVQEVNILSQLNHPNIVKYYEKYFNMQLT